VGQPRASLVAGLVVALASCSFGSPSEGVDRLVVVGDDGNVATVAPDGTDRVAVTTDATPGRPYFQPTWSPSADRLAFSRPGDSTLLVSPVDGPPEALPVAAPPFYLAWSPDESGLTLLRNAGPDGLALDYVTVEGTGIGAPAELGRGQPFYFSWSPEGDRLVSHAGSERLEIQTLGGGPAPLGPAPGSSQAPQWIGSGIVTVIREGDQQQIALVGTDGGIEPLAVAPGTVVFTADPTGSRLAVEPVGRQPATIEALYRPVPELALNRLSVLDIASGEVQSVTSQPVVAFFWSPGGDRLLVLGGTNRPGELVWSVWEDGTTTELTRFVAPTTFAADLVPFFDQYAQSMTLWSPDGAAFAFPGDIEGERGIWVQHVTGDRELRRVSDGSWVAWSPR